MTARPLSISLRALGRPTTLLALSSLWLACGDEGSPTNNGPLTPYVPPSSMQPEADAGAQTDAGDQPWWPPPLPGLDADAATTEDPDAGALEPDASTGESDAGDDGDDGDDGEEPGDTEDPPNYGLPPFIADGAPLTAEDRKWTYIEFPDTKCRDGSPAGIAVSLSASSKNVMLYLEGGGACFDTITCLANPSSTLVMQGEKTAGLFNRNQADNPVKDWNYVYVPYCTGDVHIGTKANVSVPGVLGTQQFVGYRNLETFLKRVVPTFPGVQKVLLTGISAGGFGAAGTAVLVQRAFAGVAVNLIDDSGPPLPKKAMPECLQTKWRDTWGLKDSILKDCGTDCTSDTDFIFDFGVKLARTFTDRNSGLIEAEGDSIIRGFFGAGLNNCTGTAILNSVSEADFKEGLLEFREATKAYPSFGTWYPTGTRHTWLSSDDMFTAKIGDKSLVDWVADIIENRGTSHVGGN